MAKSKALFPKAIFIVVALLSLSPLMSSALALLAGTVLALSLGNPFAADSKKLTPLLLQFSIVGLGFGMDLEVVGRAGLDGVAYTIVGVTLTMLLGSALGRALGTPFTTSLLVSAGTAICGGSAIAAVAPAIRAKTHETSVALATVFLLNAAALFIFPFIGHRLGLSESQFGLWSALAIHDTSSVVGAALQYGPRALEIATTIKLARALWIIPLTFVLAHIASRKAADQGATAKAKRPWFILGFVAAAALVTWVPALRGVGHVVAAGAKHSLVLTLFLIGAGLSRETIKAVGFRPFAQGFLLWIIVATATAGAILARWIS